MRGNYNRGLLILLVIAVTLCTFAACNAEIGDRYEETGSVNFLPATAKALNQSGATQDSSYQDISLYHWKYKIGSTKEEMQACEAANFFDHLDEDTGLGTIKGLSKGMPYWFGLEGWTTGSDAQMVWYGETQEANKLYSKTTFVSIGVYPCGKGAVYFSISAPVVNVDNIVNGEAVYNDRFVVESLTTIAGEEVSSNTNLEATYDPVNLNFVYDSIGKDADFMLTAGTYLMIVKQQSTEDGIVYTDVNDRRQLLIVNVSSGVNTLIRGSLDSSALEIIQFYLANAEGSDKGIEIVFLEGDEDSVKNLEVVAKTPDNEISVPEDNSRIGVEKDSYIKLSFTTKTDTKEPLKVYVNKTILDLTSKTDAGFIYSSKGEETLIKKASDNEIWAYSKEEYDYIVTLRYNELSKSFTIVSIDPTV